MRNILESNLYNEEINKFINNFKFNIENKNILITGATGLICSYLVDVIMAFNKKFNSNINIFAVGRDKKRAYKRFKNYFDDNNFNFIEHDVANYFNYNIDFDYIIYGAGNSHPYIFSTDPVGTMISNFNGIYNIMEYSKIHDVKRILYISSGEVYGKADNQTKEFYENYSGYLDFVNTRACYPSSKRAAETLCQSYLKQYDINVVIVRPCHVYGSTMTESDSRAAAQFIKNAVLKKDIIMKSEGKQIRSYCYVSDVVNGILKVLFEASKGEIYNISDRYSIVSIKELAEICAEVSETNVIMSMPSETEKKGYSTVDRAVLNSEKLENINWKPIVHVKDGIKRTINILNDLIE